jgi:hypothetical protein
MKPNSSQVYRNSIREAAMALGFEINKDGLYYHPDIDHGFDFSAMNPEKLMLAVFLEAKEIGAKEKANAIATFVTDLIYPS